MRELSLKSATKLVKYIPVLIQNKYLNNENEKCGTLTTVLYKTSNPHG